VVSVSSVDGGVDLVGFEASFEVFSQVVGELGGPEAAGWSAAQLEEHLEARGRELLRRLLQDHLELRAGREQRVEGVIDAEGAVRGTVEKSHRRPLLSVFGEVEVERFAYRRRGRDNVYLADAGLNLPVEKHSHGLRRLAAIESTRGSFAGAVAAIERATGQSLGRRQVQDLVERAAVDFDDFYASRRPPPAGEDTVLVLSMDGKGIVMRPDALRPGTATAAKNGPASPRGALGGEERRNFKRMAEIGAVYDICPSPRGPCDIMAPPGDTRPVAPGPVVAHKWLVASITHDAATVIADVFTEADRRDPNRARRWIALVDGNNHQIDRIGAEADQRGINVTIVVDFIHVIEYLWRAARCFYRDADPAAAQWVHERSHEILEGHATKVAGDIRRRASTGHLTATAKADALTCANYLTNKAPHLDYPTALREGWPIATGIIEGACRHLVADRMDITGARWGLDGAEAILRLRALTSNGDFDAYWNHHLTREHQRTHRTRYLHGLIPTTD
jgi:hypothetical protein